MQQKEKEKKTESCSNKRKHSFVAMSTTINTYYEGSNIEMNMTCIHFLWYRSTTSKCDAR